MESQRLNSLICFGLRSNLGSFIGYCWKARELLLADLLTWRELRTNASSGCRGSPAYWDATFEIYDNTQRAFRATSIIIVQVVETIGSTICRYTGQLTNKVSAMWGIPFSALWWSQWAGAQNSVIIQYLVTDYEPCSINFCFLGCSQIGMYLLRGHNLRIGFQVWPHECLSS
jgi:hypothetical protein